MQWLTAQLGAWRQGSSAAAMTAQDTSTGIHLMLSGPPQAHGVRHEGTSDDRTEWLWQQQTRANSACCAKREVSVSIAVVVAGVHGCKAMVTSVSQLQAVY